MNRILYERSELREGRVVLGDDRAVHIRTVLKSGVGDVLKTGEVNGPVSSGEIVEICGEKVCLKICEGAVPPRPGTDLLLALPRPKVLNRLLPQIAALGVDRLILCNASKVERYYFDTHVLDDHHLRLRLLEGLTQCGDTCLPSVRVVRELHHFLEDEAADLFASADRFVLHPGGGVSLLKVPRKKNRTVLAIGPEGGWQESEVEKFQEKGFQRVSLRDRILRSDTAAIAALAVAVLGEGDKDGL